MNLFIKSFNFYSKLNTFFSLIVDAESKIKIKKFLLKKLFFEDYHFQAVLFEIFYRLSKNETQMELEKIFTLKFSKLVISYLRIKPSNFLEDSRNFLNEINKMIPEENRKIRSFKIANLLINKQPLSEVSPTWCDLTSVDLTIWFVPYKSDDSTEKKERAPRKNPKIQNVLASFVSIPLDSIDSFNLTSNSSLFVMNKGK